MINQSQKSCNSTSSNKKKQHEVLKEKIATKGEYKKVWAQICHTPLKMAVDDLLVVVVFIFLISTHWGGMGALSTGLLPGRWQWWHSAICFSSHRKTIMSNGSPYVTHH